MNTIRILATFLVLLTQAFGERSEFPLEKGTFWDYDGNVAWVAPNTAVVQRQTITWRMEIIDVISRDLVVAAVVKGHPRDLISFDPKREPGVSVIVQVHLRKHYLLEGERAQAVLKRLKDPSDVLSDLVRESEVFLETPVSLGQRFCQTEMMTRTDWRNCWFVEEERTPSVKSVPGVPADWDGPEWGIAYRSSPSSEFVAFAPGIGLTSYDYGRDGTTAYVQLKLTAFGRRETQ
jgi:hypothetical protein